MRTFCFIKCKYIMKYSPTDHDNAPVNMILSHFFNRISPGNDITIPDYFCFWTDSIT